MNTAEGAENSDNTEDAGNAEDVDDDPAQYCEYCELWLNGRDQMRDHLAGKKHRKNEINAKEIASNVWTVCTSSQSPTFLKEILTMTGEKFCDVKYSDLACVEDFVCILERRKPGYTVCCGTSTAEQCLNLKLLHFFNFGQAFAVFRGH